MGRIFRESAPTPHQAGELIPMSGGVLRLLSGLGCVPAMAGTRTRRSYTPQPRPSNPLHMVPRDTWYESRNSTARSRNIIPYSPTNPTSPSLVEQRAVGNKAVVEWGDPSCRAWQRRRQKEAESLRSHS